MAFSHWADILSLLKEFKGNVNYGDWYVDGVDLAEMATIILENNYFEFDGQMYWQKQGTAIGSKFSPAYANIFMYVLETRMLGCWEYVKLGHGYGDFWMTYI